LVEIHAAHATPAAHRDLWTKAILRIVGSIAGPEARDLRVVHELVRLCAMWGTVLQYRDPGGLAARPVPVSWSVWSSAFNCTACIGRPSRRLSSSLIAASLRSGDGAPRTSLSSSTR
jgi:hypothetical protein